MVEYYNEHGKLVESDQSHVARVMRTDEGCKYWVLMAAGKIYDPLSRIHKRDEYRNKFTSASEKLFYAYISYLRGREQRKLREIQRMMIDG